MYNGEHYLATQTLDRWPLLFALADASSVIAGAMTRAKRLIIDRSAGRPSRFAGAGITLLRTNDHDHLPEIWCRCDGGPHGSPRIAADAYAAALSVEVRYGGLDILAHPSTYCDQGDPPSRSYFRSTNAHNSAGIDGRNQPIDGGRFPCSRHTHAQEPEVIDDGDIANWTAEHVGYRWFDPPMRHRRSVLLDRASRIVDIVDQIDGGGHYICPAFHFGPEIQVELGESCAFLNWPGSTTPGAARLELPIGLSWSLYRAEIDTILDWYTPRLGARVPAFTLLGRGRSAAGAPLATRLEFDAEMLPRVSFPQPVSWSTEGTCGGKEWETESEAR